MYFENDDNLDQMVPEFITFSGIDDRTDLNRAQQLSNQYPIEWGVLFSATNKDSRYPSTQTINEISEISFLKSIHFCGTVAKEIQSGIIPKIIDLNKFNRIQVNGHAIDTSFFKKIEKDFSVELIIQSRENEFPPCNVLQLFDQSGGQGLSPSSVPKLVGDKMVGYAGGIGPNNVLNYLSSIKGSGNFWIDMESNIRSNGWLDLGKVEKVCQLVFNSSEWLYRE